MFQIEKLEGVVRDLNVNVSNLERDNRSSENQIGELKTELEHVRCELTEAKGQYKECAQEVSHGTRVYATILLWRLVTV